MLRENVQGKQWRWVNNPAPEGFLSARTGDTFCSDLPSTRPTGRAMGTRGTGAAREAGSRQR
jgi:hypothetical protein